MLVEWLEVSMIDLLLNNTEIANCFFTGFLQGFIMSAVISAVRAVYHAFKIIAVGRDSE